ncbi:MAG: hypothetical protein ABJC04_00840 [Verrucomicrobiota bacterium]
MKSGFTQNLICAREIFNFIADQSLSEGVRTATEHDAVFVTQLSHKRPLDVTVTS